MSRTDDTKTLLAIEAAMSPEDQRALLDKAAVQNYWLRGAKVADVLDVYYDHDAFLERTEPFWDAHPVLLKSKHSHAIALSLIAAALLDRDDEWALRLADRAVAKLT